MNCAPIILLNLSNIFSFSNDRELIKLSGVEYYSLPSMHIIYEKAISEDAGSCAQILIPQILNKKVEGLKVEIAYYLKNENKVIKEEKGIIFKVVTQNGNTILFIKDLFFLLESRFGLYFSDRCRANFCDDKCGLKEENYNFFGKISDIIDQIQVIDDNINFVNYSLFEFGKFVILSTAEEIKVVKVNRGVITLLTPPHKWEIGQVYKLVQGCNKTLEVCSKTYKNAVNFRGEPFMFSNFSSSMF